MSISTAMSCVTGVTDPYIRVKVKGQDGTELFFKIRRDAKLKKLMNVYCDRCAMDLISTVFLFDGCRIQGKQTPDEVIYSFSSQFLRVIIILEYW
ncbi:hypothetical protein RD792_017084 [Penstemon davidsonii]|uniref:Rad60/SUMO-like domain-containing protein n=1 Tax=Penstemon davidsonii TaxID=160366 RepID=A0ABR0CMT9_9LAMI|nr:hypothetical protein RD792_017084 [Penstemon davidsonii]